MLTSHFDILGVQISAVNLSLACGVIRNWIENGIRTYVCIVPVSTVVECQKDKTYLEIVNQAGMATPDGMPVVWLGKWAGYKQVSRTYGPDLVLAVCEMSQEKGYRNYFYGGSPEALSLLTLKLKKRFPRLNIAGRLSPPFGELSFDIEKKVLSDINQARPDILWVGLGSPKQDYWMQRTRDQLNVPVMVGVGAAFDFLSGTKRQAPLWIRSAGLEWFFRLCCEPRRLWKRYLIGNTRFIYFLLRDYVCHPAGRKR